MSSDTYMTVKRGGTPVSTIPPFYVQIDNMSMAEAAYYGGASPYQRFAMYTTAIYDLRQEDLLIDTKNIDPKTNTLTQYRVISQPETFPDSHMELAADKVRGT
jgi:hypothetical protein